MTGRRAGYCADNDMPGNASQRGRRFFGRGYDRGFGRGMGRGRFLGQDDYPRPVYQEPAPEEEKAYLENLLKGMEKELGDIKDRIKELVKEEK